MLRPTKSVRRIQFPALSLTEVQGRGLAEDPEVVSPGARLPVVADEPAELLLAVGEEVLYPGGGLGEVPQILTNLPPELLMVLRLASNLVKDDLVSGSVVPTVTV